MSALADTVLLGDQRPRVACSPSDVVANFADDAIELAAACGLVLDDWQQHVLRESLGERADGKWAAYDVAVVVARQNGKGAILMAREIAGALLFGERLILHTAHELDTARDHMKKLDALAEESPFLRRHLPRDGFKWGRGYEEAQFSNGAVIRFKSRTRKGGRGLSGDLVVYDEAFELPADTFGGSSPLLRARENPQLWYASSVVDQSTMPHGVVLSQVRQRAMSDDPGDLAYFEWSNPSDLVEGLTADEVRDRISDPDVWAAANPALGIRIDPEQVAREVDSMPLQQFLVECLSVGDWPALGPDTTDDSRMPLAAWNALAGDFEMVDPVVFGVEIAPDQTSAAVAAAGWTSGGQLLVELVDARRGASWVAGRVTELVESHGPSLVVHDAYTDLGHVGCETIATSASDVKEAHAAFLRHFDDGQLAHLGDPRLADEVERLETRMLSGGMVFKGKHARLRAVVLAVWGLTMERETVDPFVFVQ